MGRKLVIKRISNEFDEFIVKSIKKNCPQCDVIDAFRLKGRIGRRIVNIAKSSYLLGNIPFLLNVNKKNIKLYDEVVLFDDYPDLPLIRWIRTNNQSCTIKMWFWNVPDYSIDDYREYAELYCFDKEYCSKNKVIFEEQFYFDSIAFNKDNQIERDIVYIGADKNRKSILLDIADKANKYGISYSFFLVSNKKEKAVNIEKNIFFLSQPFSYDDVLIENSKSKAILELVRADQTGLTWRALEALYFKKKLITNNISIVNSQLYNSNNVFILGKDNDIYLKEFINSPYIPLKNEIINLYSFKRWAHNMGLK